MDEAKNMALLFFMDHLMQKNGRRTIHDLSCQFGARGFTPEMRDAVGTTQEGLTDFLNQHPSLFTVEGDQVCLNGFGDITAKNNPLLQATANGRNRDYEKEAVQFFEAKLQKFGPELQIKSLLGHRSQAAPEVRLVSGRHLKDFCEFLQSQTEYFVVEGDRVRLKNMPEPSHAGVELDDEGKPLAGVKAKQAAVEYLKGVVEMNEDQPIPMDVFYQKFCDRFSHTVRQEVATNPKELLQFLKLNRNVFFIRSNKVSLVKNRTSEDGSESGSTEGSELENNNNNGILTQNALNRINLVKALKPAQEAISSVNSEIDAMEEKVIGVDFKTVTLGIQGEEFLSLVVVATPNQIVVFDLVHSDTILLESGLKEILESEKIIKAMHEARRVASLLAHRYAVNLRKVFDTQIAHAVLQHEKFGKALSEMRSISFLNLQRVYYPQSIMMSDATPRKLSQSPSWGQRPITDEMLMNVVEEAHCLVTVLYRMLSNMLPNHLRLLFEEKCIEALIATPNRPPPTTLQTNGIQYRNPRRALASPPNNNAYVPRSPSPRQTCEASTQTFSTGEINVINIYYDN
ncbi:Exonuclease 3'-5' domain-containing protein 1 [Toxocara canis]|uniref:Exonuclease 3'-5' domain-containing protein 1 n=1 Tax=Toxocara canis TaxID=6265 RepID=A0A0B2URQ1_TOXCA|nr:Exonuclease 3'-5' domain-containing protein 1 [Toxocara canis]